MWPVLLNMTRDECRRTLRRLELEAYSNVISVFRAQGALEEDRKKLLEELRAVLHISHDRHSAEARRVSNDELLATIAEHIAGPNTGLAWISEGRRIIPLMPRGIAQTMYTEIADKVAEVTAAENKELKKMEDKLVTPVSKEVEMPDPETAESALECSEKMDDVYPPIATEDHSSKIWETEIICRKRKVAEDDEFEDTITPVKNMRNIPVNMHQKFVNLSQVYSKYSQPTASKQSSQSKHSYNQVSKVSSKPCQTRAPRQQKPKVQKPRAPRQKKQPKDVQSPPAKQFNPVSLQMEYSGPPNTFQASYAQSILSNKNRDFMDEFKPKVKSSPGMVSESPTMHLLTQPATVPHELGLSENAHPDDPKSLQAQSTPIAKQPLNTIKASQIILKSRDSEKKVPVPDIKIVQKSNDNIKILANRQVVVAPSSAQKTLNARKLVAAKVIGSIPKVRTSATPVKAISDKVVVVSKAPIDTRISHPKFVITSSSTTTSMKSTPVSTNNYSPPTSETLTPKGIPATDLKVSAKTFVNPKSGKTMVVLPAKSSKEGPLFHFKGVSTAMKLVSVSSQPNTMPTSKFHPGASTLKPTIVSSSPKILGTEPIKTANLADIVPVKGLTPTQKVISPIVRPVSSKGNVIVVQKSANLGKTLKFTRNGNDMSKIIMGKNVNHLLQAKSEQGEISKSNVIVLELNNEQSGKTTTMSEILNSHIQKPTPEENKPSHIITQDTPVLLDTHPEEGNASSLDSTASLDKDENGQNEAKDSPSDWDMENESVPDSKKTEDKLNSLHLDLGMSSESETEYMADDKNKSDHSSQDSLHQETQRDESLMADDEFPEGKREPRRDILDDQLSRLLAEDSSNSSDSQTVEQLPMTNE
ncbi:BRCA2-interacting transcriptional repressor EMSY isoform X2 [Pieris brassicae]|uniref:BRCA2-interacting transcriptional repressor EMSY isoform X2 n=1 Tax=Pieris brassicae TaxID=7116 RepID=UPI001E65EABD|nr:BRCA2-interacting transcriptional repressor EMSY isoform X2 [Pieris brassicae]